MGTCQYCNKTAKTVSKVIGFCADCIRAHFEEVWPKIKAVHDHSRREYGLPVDPPNAVDGVSCPLCFHRCRIPEGAQAFAAFTASRTHAMRCKEAAERAGLHRVDIGNVHLLGENY